MRGEPKSLFVYPLESDTATFQVWLLQRIKLDTPNHLRWKIPLTFFSLLHQTEGRTIHHLQARRNNIIAYWSLVWTHPHKSSGKESSEPLVVTHKQKARPRFFWSHTGTHSNEHVSGGPNLSPPQTKITICESSQAAIHSASRRETMSLAVNVNVNAFNSSRANPRVPKVTTPQWLSREWILAQEWHVDGTPSPPPSVWRGCVWPVAQTLKW